MPAEGYDLSRPSMRAFGVASEQELASAPTIVFGHHPYRVPELSVHQVNAIRLLWSGLGDNPDRDTVADTIVEILHIAVARGHATTVERFRGEHRQSGCMSALVIAAELLPALDVVMSQSGGRLSFAASKPFRKLIAG